MKFEPFDPELDVVIINGKVYDCKIDEIYDYPLQVVELYVAGSREECPLEVKQAINKQRRIEKKREKEEQP